ncbi:oxygen-binding di-iron domain-containing protein [Clostridium sp. DL1XJH146]
MNKTMETIEINEGIFWIGSGKVNKGLNCNSYLIIDEDEAVFIDPGSAIDFEEVYRKVISLIPLEKIKYVILSHQDPDICSALPLFEKIGLKAKVVTHWRTMTIATHYGISSEEYIVNEQNYNLNLKSGRNIQFIPTPYLHFPGAIATYDRKSKILFSSDLFGAISNKWSLYANENYIEAMKIFHEHYMPGNEIIRPVMEKFLSMDISMIASQHGSIINKNIKDYIKVLRDLQCGFFLNSIKRELTLNGGYLMLCNDVLRRYDAVFEAEEIREIFKNSGIKLDTNNLAIKDFDFSGIELWDNFFEIIYNKKGIRWITVIEPLLNRLIKEYDISKPKILKSEILKFEKEKNKLISENDKLKDINKKLNENIKITEEKLIKCPITGFYNENFFMNYISRNIEELSIKKGKQNSVLMYIEIDNMIQFNYKYGNTEGDNTIKKLSYILKEMKKDNHIIFKKTGPSFAYYLIGNNKNQAIDFAEKIRNRVEKSKIFIENITVSIGLVSFDEIINRNDILENELAQSFLRAAEVRINKAKMLGKNIVLSNSDISEYDQSIGKILVIDNDIINIDVLRTIFEYENFTVISAMDGYEAIEILEKTKPDIVISEIMIPKIEGFLIREKMLSSSTQKAIPFIFMSHQKNEETVKRAFELDVDYYFKKPYLISEVVGVVKKIIKGAYLNESKY